MNGYNLGLLFFWIIAPILIGKLFALRKEGTKQFTGTFEYILGFVVMWDIFHVLCVPMAMRGATISKVGVIYTILLIGLCLVSIILNRKSWKTKKQYAKEKKYSFIFVVVGLVIGIQILRSVLYMPFNYSDDITYMAMINDMASTDRIHGNFWWNGMEKPFAETSYKYRYTSYYSWVAFIAQVTEIHPLILCKTLMPILYIIMFYMIWWLFAQWLYKKDMRKQECFLLILSVVALFAGYSQYTISKRLLLYVWNGKTVLAVVILPFLFYCINRFTEQKMTIREIVILLCIEIAGTASSLMGIGLVPIMVMVVCLVAAIRQKQIYPVLQGILCCIPMAIYMAVVLLGKA